MMMMMMMMMMKVSVVTSQRFDLLIYLLSLFYIASLIFWTLG